MLRRNPEVWALALLGAAFLASQEVGSVFARERIVFRNGGNVLPVVCERLVAARNWAPPLHRWTARLSPLR